MTRLRLTGLTAAAAVALAVSACGTSASTASRPLPTWFEGGSDVITPLPGQASAAVAGSAPTPAAASPTPGIGEGQPSGLGTPATTVSATSDLKFDPATSTVKVGDVIQWNNTGSVPHNVTFDNNDALTSATLNQGDTWQVKITVAGTYAYHCTFHPGMNGQITVSG